MCSSLQETYIEIQTEHLPQLLLRMVAALTCHLQALGLGELTHCLRLCSKILSKVQPPLVSPLALPSVSQTQGLSNSTGNSARESSKDKEEQRVRKPVNVPSRFITENFTSAVGDHVFPPCQTRSALVVSQKSYK